MDRDLGNQLKELRQQYGLTLRQVEDAVGISNAYLSQLENGKIKMPSVQVLYKLAQLYRTALDLLLWHAGIIEVLGDIIKLGVETTPEEQQQLLRYLKFIRDGR